MGGDDVNMRATLWPIALIATREHLVILCWWIVGCGGPAREAVNQRPGTYGERAFHAFLRKLSVCVSESAVNG